jgi:hypothetical protein
VRLFHQLAHRHGIIDHPPRPLEVGGGMTENGPSQVDSRRWADTERKR